MADALARIKEEIASVRARAAAQRKNAKEEGMELLMDICTTALTSTVGALEGKDKLAETFEVLGYNVPTKLAMALGAKALALGSRGNVRKIANEAGRSMLNIAGYASAKAAAAAK